MALKESSGSVEDHKGLAIEASEFQNTSGTVIADSTHVTSGGTVTAATSITATLGDITATNGNFVASTIGKGLVLKQGANGKVGTFVNNGTTPVTTSNTSIAITDTIVISLNTVGGTVGATPHVATITASTGFTTVGAASDTSTYNYTIISNSA